MSRQAFAQDPRNLHIHISAHFVRTQPLLAYPFTSLASFWYVGAQTMHGVLPSPGNSPPQRWCRPARHTTQSSTRGALSTGDKVSVNFG